MFPPTVPVPPHGAKGRTAFQAIWRAFYNSQHLAQQYKLRKVVRFRRAKYLHVFVRNNVPVDSLAFESTRFPPCVALVHPVSHGPGH